MAKRAKKPEAEEEDHGWHGYGSGKPPFEGAAGPIHVIHGGKYRRKKIGSSHKKGKKE